MGTPRLWQNQVSHRGMGNRSSWERGWIWLMKVVGFQCDESCTACMCSHRHKSRPNLWWHSHNSKLLESCHLLLASYRCLSLMRSHSWNLFRQCTFESTSRENDKNEYRLARELCKPLIPVAYVKWQFVNMKDFSRYRLLLPQLASDVLQNVPFCIGERGLQGHALLAVATPSPRHLYSQPSPSTPEPLPGW
jgi:hypothetical protein